MTEIQNKPVLTSLKLEKFRQFTNIELELSPNPIVFIGNPGSGKTSLLWGCLLFLHAFNSRSSHATKTKPPISIDSIKPELAALLASPAFGGPSPNFGNLVKKEYIKASLSGSIDSRPFKFSIDHVGKMEIECFPDLELNDKGFPKKIQFALSTPYFLFKSPEEEVFGLVGIYSSNQQNIRYLWSKLMPLAKRDVLSKMNEIFGIEYIEYNDKKMNITEPSGDVFEVSFVSSTIQRVLHTEILFQTILSSTETQKIFFFEEPDTFSHSSKYFESILERSKKNNIQLIVVSCSPDIVNFFPESDRRDISSLIMNQVPEANI